MALVHEILIPPRISLSFFIFLANQEPDIHYVVGLGFNVPPIAKVITNTKMRQF